MTTSFPTSLDARARPASSDTLGTTGMYLDVVIDDILDAVEALEAKVGVNSSAVTTSHDYKLANAVLLKALVDAKGDLLAATANDTVARLAVGSNGQVLTADSAETTGLKWAAAGGSQVTAKATRTSGDVTMNNTGAFTADVDTGLDLTIAATAGDVVRLAVQCSVGAEAAISAFDFVTRVSAADVNFVSSGTATPYTWGIPGSRGEISTAISINAATLYTVAAGDISGGNVTFRLRYKLHTATNKTLYASGGINLRVEAWKV